MKPQLGHRRSIRLQNYDYSQTGAYFITFCLQKRKCLFGEIKNDKIQLSDIGKIVSEEWIKSADIREEIELDEWGVMPNHFHGIVVITGAASKVARPVAPIGPQPKSIGALMAGFKSAATIRVNQMYGTPRKKLWQRNYWDHIIRNEAELNRIRKYILENPANWEQDKLNDGPGNIVLEPHAVYGDEIWMT